MKSTEQIRFEACWHENLPAWFKKAFPTKMMFEVDENDEYVNEFAQAAWRVWHAAQFSKVKSDL